MMQTMICRKIITRLNTIVALLLLSCPLLSFAQGIEYDVEVIIFENLRDTTVDSSDTLLLPVVQDAQPIPERSIPGAAIQPIGELRLQVEAEKIRNSGSHRLMYHGGWRQGSIDEENAPYMSIELGSSFTMLTEQGDADSVYLRGYLNPPLNPEFDLRERRSARLFGGIKVWVGRFLHFDTLLAYTPPGADYSYSFQSERRLRSRQLNYIDNPKVGIITKIFPVDDSAPN